MNSTFTNFFSVPSDQSFTSVSWSGQRVLCKRKNISINIRATENCPRRVSKIIGSQSTNKECYSEVWNVPIKPKFEILQDYIRNFNFKLVDRRLDEVGTIRRASSRDAKQDRKHDEEGNVSARLHVCSKTAIRHTTKTLYGEFDRNFGSFCVIHRDAL